MKFFIQRTSGFANIAILVIVLLAAAGVGYVVVTRVPEAPAVDWRNTEWKTYRNEVMGFEFRYPDIPIPGLPSLDPAALIFSHNVNRYIFIGAFKLGMGGPKARTLDAWVPGNESASEYKRRQDVLGREDVEYYLRFFRGLNELAENDGCTGIYVPMFGSRTLGDVCRVFVSTSGVRMTTGFYPNIHGAPPFVAFFPVGNRYQVTFMLYYQKQKEFSRVQPQEVRGGTSDEFATRIARGEFPEITDKIEMFKAVLKTVKVFNPVNP